MTYFDSTGSCIPTFFATGTTVSTSRFRVVVVSVGTRTESEELDELEELGEFDEHDFSVTLGTGMSLSSEAVAAAAAAARSAESMETDVGTSSSAIRS